MSISFFFLWLYLFFPYKVMRNVILFKTERNKNICTKSMKNKFKNMY